MSRKRRVATGSEIRAYLWTCLEDELIAALNEGIMARAVRFPKANKRIAKAAVAKHRAKQVPSLDTGGTTTKIKGDGNTSQVDAEGTAI